MQNFYAIEIEAKVQRHERQRKAAAELRADQARQQRERISCLQVLRQFLARPHARATYPVRQVACPRITAAETR